jgi:DNA repair protein RecO (recombination protein O)
VTEAKLLRRFRPAGKDLAGLYGGYYVAELLDAMTHDYEASPELFDLADETLAELAGGEAVGRCVVRFELGLLRLLGMSPSLDRCADCGVAVEPTGRVRFGHLDGGVICDRCREGKAHVASVGASVVRAMAELADPDDRRWRRLEIDARTGGELRGVLNHYMAHLLGRKPRMQGYLKWTRTSP